MAVGSYIGEIIMLAGTIAPTDWKLCEGQLVDKGTYALLYGVIGYTYGGSGSKFALPDLRGRMPIQQGTGTGLTPHSLGQKGGSEDVAITVDQMPSHQYGVECDNGSGDGYAPPGKLPAGAQDRDLIYGDPVEPTQLMNSGMITANGGGKAHPNVPPYLAINFAISMLGTEP